jgi:hypothetical protein
VAEYKSVRLSAVLNNFPLLHPLTHLTPHTPPIIIMSGLLDKGKELLAKSGNNNNTSTGMQSTGNEDYVDKGAFLSCFLLVYNIR